LGHRLFTYLSDKFGHDEVYGTMRRGEGRHWFVSEYADLIITNVDAHCYDSIARVIGEVRPDIVINCIGIIKQLNIANDPLIIVPINTLFPHRLAALCKVSGAKMIHVSTDCVFSGRKGNYTEDDTPDPIDLYGHTKLLGEVTAQGCLTLRTSIIGRELHTKYGLIEWFLSQRGKTVKGFSRAIYSGFTTQALVEIIGNLIEQHPDLSGLWHVSSAPISKYDLLQLVKNTFKLNISIEKDETFFCDRSLDSSRFRKIVGDTPSTWPEMIERLYHDSKTM